MDSPILHSILPITPMQYNVGEWKETWALLDVRFPDWNLMAIFASHYTDNGFREWVINIWADVWWLNQFFWPNWFGSLVIWVIPTLADVTSLQSKTWLKWSKTQTVFPMGFIIRFCSLMKRGFLQMVEIFIELYIWSLGLCSLLEGIKQEWSDNKSNY